MGHTHTQGISVRRVPPGNGLPRALCPLSIERLDANEHMCATYVRLAQGRWLSQGQGPGRSDGLCLWKQAVPTCDKVKLAGGGEEEQGAAGAEAEEGGEESDEGSQRRPHLLGDPALGSQASGGTPQGWLMRSRTRVCGHAARVGPRGIPAHPADLWADAEAHEQGRHPLFLPRSMCSAHRHSLSQTLLVSLGSCPCSGVASPPSVCPGQVFLFC